VGRVVYISHLSAFFINASHLGFILLSAIPVLKYFGFYQENKNLDENPDLPLSFKKLDEKKSAKPNVYDFLTSGYE
jgi:hypothetical protein